jgi:hypothetical protein
MMEISTRESHKKAEKKNNEKRRVKLVHRQQQFSDILLPLVGLFTCVLTNLRSSSAAGETNSEKESSMFPVPLFFTFAYAFIHSITSLQNVSINA